MKTVFLSARDVLTLDRLYDCLDNELNFPPYFGRNLDALYDVLTDICEETHISLPGRCLPETPLRALTDAERANPALRLHFRPV